MPLGTIVIGDKFTLKMKETPYLLCFTDSFLLMLTQRVFVVELKDRYDDMVEKLLVEDKVNGYSCSSVYKGSSCIPSKVEITAKKDGKPVLTETTDIW